jgi:RNA recognition motif-containing protein
MSDFNRQQEEADKTKLFVGNLPFSIKQEDLEGIFAEFGEIVEISLITDRMSGRSKGFAFVKYATEEAAQAAVDGMKDQKIGERDVIVNIARPRAPRENRSRGNFRGGRNNYRSDNRRDSYDRG